MSQCAGAAGHLAPHGAAGLAEDRVLLLPVQVPGGARRAGEGAPGQVGARPGAAICASVAAAGGAEPGTRVPVRAGEGGSLHGRTEAPTQPLGLRSARRSCPVGRIFVRERKRPEARETQVDARGKRQGTRGRQVGVGVGLEDLRRPCL